MPIFEILETVSHFEDDLSRVTIVTKNNDIHISIYPYLCLMQWRCKLTIV